jgi:hypothetical protein
MLLPNSKEEQSVRPLRFIAVVLLLITFSAVLSSADTAQDIEFSIRYQDKQIYVPGSDVLVKFTILNNRSTTYRFRIAENRMFNVEFDVRTLSNVPVEPAAHFTTERTSNQQLYYRDVALEPGEEFSFTENLSEYVQIISSGIFVVNARFYPDLVRGNDADMSGPFSSNGLSLTIRPGLAADERVAAQLDDRTGEILTRAALPPDEVVAYVITALQDGAWNRYFLYMDIEGLLQSDSARARSYARLSDPDRQVRLDAFADELRTSLVDPLISAIPTDFTMVRTTYDPDEATVLVDEEFRFPTYSETKRYTYFLRRRDRVWYIYDYAVTNLGTE